MFDYLKNQVAVLQTDSYDYPNKAPFNPSDRYPEYPFDEIDPDNKVYYSVRDLLLSLGLDKDHFGQKTWNPLGDIIQPGDAVVIKPNFVSEPRSSDLDFKAIMTHASVIRPIIDYCLIALKGKGTLVVADAPQSDSDFTKVMEMTKITDVLQYINQKSSLNVKLVDLRQEIFLKDKDIIIERKQVNGDPKGYTVIDLGSQSAFNAVEKYSHTIYGADYDYEAVQKHHSNGRHEYCISNTILGADVIINMPKLKTHKKAGITVCLKNLVGINGNKNYLPHFRFGSSQNGGDEYADNSLANGLNSRVIKFGLSCFTRFAKHPSLMHIAGNVSAKLTHKKILHMNSGNWWGNDTIWRTIVDLNRILFCADKTGTLHPDIQRKYLAIVDGIIAGEGDGPLFPLSKPCGVLLAGLNPVAVDQAAAEVMGFDWSAIPQIVGAKELLFDGPCGVFEEQSTHQIATYLNFNPPQGWENMRIKP